MEQLEKAQAIGLCFTDKEWLRREIKFQDVRDTHAWGIFAL